MEKYLEFEKIGARIKLRNATCQIKVLFGLAMAFVFFALFEFKFCNIQLLN